MPYCSQPSQMPEERCIIKKQCPSLSPGCLPAAVPQGLRVAAAEALTAVLRLSSLASC